MASPTTRSEFKENCLRRLGKPVVEINVDDDQVEDRVDEALRYYWDYHFDGSEKIYYKYQVTDQDKTNRYITMPENIIGVINIFDLGSALGTNNLFNIRYQIAREHLSMLDMIVTGELPFQYDKTTNQLKIIMDWNGRIAIDNYLVFQCRRIIDPTTYSKVYNDLWLKEYTTQLFKQQWGTNLKQVRVTLS